MNLFIILSPKFFNFERVKYSTLGNNNLLE